MPVTSLTILGAVSFVSALSAGIWLFLHLTSVASAFAGNADIVEAKSAPRFSRAAVVIAIAILMAGATACVALVLAAR